MMDMLFGHVLIVDDNQDCAESLALLIEAEGFSVSIAGTLAEARAEISHCRPRLVFLDLRLPDGCGLELLEQTRNVPGLGVVMLSGSSDWRDDQQARQLGALDFLVKPADLSRLPSMLARLAR